MPMPKIHQVNFGTTEMPLLEKYIEQKVDYLWNRMRTIRETLLPRWVRIYRGTPQEKEAKFPWPGAANLVIQLAGTHCDELLSRVMAIWATLPIYRAEIYGDYKEGDGVDQCNMIESFLDKMAFEPTELDLYRVEETTFSSTIRYGTGLVKFPYEYLVEKQPTSIDGGANAGSKMNYTDIVRRDGPHPEAVPLNLFGIDPIWPNLANADFIYHVNTKHKEQLEAMKGHSDIYDVEAIDKILKTPDRNGPDEFRRELEADKMEQAPASNECADEWDIYECWFRYRLNAEQTFSLIAYYHKESRTHLGCIYNIYPNNEWPFEDAKLAYDDDTYFGYGFCEMLDAYQEEISKTHNWRRNARDFAMTGIGRVNKNSKLSSIVQLFPGLLVPADEGEIEPLQFGTQALSIDTGDEQLTLALAKERSGVDPAIGGAGGGVVNAKRGIYSAQGTAMVMQQQNNRNNLRMNDMRTAHVRMGRKLLNIYSHFGIGKRARSFGDQAELLTRALGNYKDGKLGLAIRAATASANKELEKQNDILLSATLERLYTGDAQIIQTLATPGCPPELAEYYKEVLKAKNALMSHILRNFGHADISRLIPVPAILKEQRNGAINPGSNSGQVGSQPSQIGGAIPVGGGPAIGAVPTTTQTQ